MTAEIVEEQALRDRVCVFEDRCDAGGLLARKLCKYAGREDVVVFALAAGGVPVGYAVAREMGVSVEVVVVRKVQVPWNTEAGFGAVTWDGEVVLNDELVRHLGLTREMIEDSVSRARRNVQERLDRFRRGRPMPSLENKTVILVDDGLASGFTMLAAVRAAKKRGASRLVVAVPTASDGAVDLLSGEVDEIVCLNIRTGLPFAVADAYKNWCDVTDDDVVRILEKVDKPA